MVHITKAAALASVIAIPLLTGVVNAAIVGPYTADANTKHLWHMDDSSSPATPASGVVGSFNLAADQGKNNTGLATLGNTAYSGFGSAGSTSSGSSTGFKGSAIAASAVTGAGGAFTFEALINVSTLTPGQDILSMEGETTAARAFQFRISSGNLTFTNINGGSPGAIAIPTTGDDAWVANEWFHVAATYTGAEGDAGNFQYYWTKVDPSRTQASVLGAAKQMTADLVATSAIFGVGNNFRVAGSSNQQNLEGLIDEVRISSVARSADQFIFTVPEPASLGLLGLGGLVMGRRRGR